MDPIAKYNSFAWRNNRFWMWLLLFSGFGFSQSSDNTVANQTLTARYPMAILKSYQGNSLDKLGDLYHYLNLLSATDDKELQQQLKETVYSLFVDKNTLVDNILTEKNDQIPLSYLLDNVASKKMMFVIKDQEVSKTFFSDYWFDHYRLEITANGETTSREFRHFIYLRPQDKSFGETTKTVLQVSLGTID